MGLYGTNEVYPSVWECLQAEKVFSDTVLHFAPCRDMSKAIIVKNALAEVWRAGRLYQLAIERSCTKREAAKIFPQMLEEYGYLAACPSAKGGMNG